MKKILIFIFILLLAVSVKAALPDGSSCLNNADCNSNICQGGECRSADIRDLFTPDTTDDDDDDDDDNGGYCLENWQCGSWTACVNSKQTRTCPTDLNNCQNEFPIIEPIEERPCTLLASPTCNDGIQNQGEQGPDCGGPCITCADCYDSERNYHDGLWEEGIDCGGPCMPCKGAATKMLIIITIIIVVLLLILGFWYWKIRGTGEVIGRTAKQFRPPIQPSSRLKI